MNTLLLLRYLWYLPVRIFASCNPRPLNPREGLKLDADTPVVYVMQSDSISNLLTLEKLTRTSRLPNPFVPVTSLGDPLTRTVFMKKVPFIGGKARDYGYQKVFRQWIDYCQEYHTDIQIVPVTIFWSRNPGHEGEPYRDTINQPYSKLKKFFRIMFFGYDNLTVLSGPIRISSILEHRSGTDEDATESIARACRLHFERRHNEIVGPKCLNRDHLIQDLLNSDYVKSAIRARADKTRRNYSEIEAEAYGMLNEMAADYSYHTTRFFAALLHPLWSKFYHGINVFGADRVRELISSGHEIVYIPCHRSHMDYLLLAYVLFSEGLVMPHVAAGNNLNFFPINRFLRQCGAFFIRRKFKGDELYTAVFRQYLYTLFNRGYSAEFYIEGGRSRTGRTLPPRTGIVAMAVQAQLSGIERPISFVPIYLGYEKVLEVSSYMKELNGAKKAKESPWQLLNFYKRLRYYGRGYVSFGEPIVLTTFLRETVPDWRKYITPGEFSRPAWLFDTVNALSDEIVMRLNSSATTNGLNLSALALLSVREHRLPLASLQNIINFYIFILKSSHSISESALPRIPGQVLLQQALELKPFSIEEINGEKVAVPSKKQIIYLSYFRNNILHFFVLPALIATIVAVHRHLSMADIVLHTRNVFYFLRHELFAPVREHVLDQTIRAYVKAFQLAEYFSIVDKSLYQVNPDPGKRALLDILSNSIHDNLMRYVIGVEAVKRSQNGTCDQNKFIESCVRLCHRLPEEITNNSPEFSDPITFRVMSETFVRHRYVYVSEIDGTYTKNPVKLQKLINAAGPLLPEEIRKSLDNV